MMDPVYETETFNRKQLHAILDNTVDGIVVINSKGYILSFNQACEKLFGYKPSEALGRNVTLLMPEPYRSQHDQYLVNYLTSRAPKIIGIGREVVGCRKDSTTFPMWLSIGEVIEGEDHFFVGIIRDITAQKTHENEVGRYTRALEKSNTELDEFVYIISHDLKEPVRGMYSFAQFLDEDYADILDEEGRHRIATLMKMAKRMDSLIEKLLYFSRLERTELSMAPVDLQESLNEVIDLLEPHIEQTKAKIIIETPLPEFYCDQARVGEIFRNLITNGIKYNKSGNPEIRIGMKDGDGTGANGPVFYVSDNGIGIPEKHYQSVFKMFKRLHGRDDYGGGTGSGLTITQRIVQQHGGKIWIESGIGQGTTFLFTLSKERDYP